VNHVDAVDVNAVDLGRKLENRVGIANDLPNILKVFPFCGLCTTGE
jgi:hypothetical protein